MTPRRGKSVRLGYTTMLCCCFFLLRSYSPPPRPLSSARLPRYQQTPLRLPSAGLYLRRPRVIIPPMPQTGQTGVGYTLHAALRKTTTTGPLFVNQTQGQKTKRRLPHPESITAENCRAEEHRIDLPSRLFTRF